MFEDYENVWASTVMIAMITIPNLNSAVSWVANCTIQMKYQSQGQLQSPCGPYFALGLNLGSPCHINIRNFLILKGSMFKEGQPGLLCDNKSEFIKI